MSEILKIVEGSFRSTVSDIEPTTPFTVFYKVETGKLRNSKLEKIDDKVINNLKERIKTISEFDDDQQAVLSSWIENSLRISPVINVPITVGEIEPVLFYTQSSGFANPDAPEEAVPKEKIKFNSTNREFILSLISPAEEGTLIIKAYVQRGDQKIPFGEQTIQVFNPKQFNLNAPLSLSRIADRNEFNINVGRPSLTKSPLSILFKGIVDSTNRISFNTYKKYIDGIFCSGGKPDDYFNKLNARRSLPFNDTEGYRVLKSATEAFLMLQAGVFAELGSWVAEKDEKSLLLHFEQNRVQFSASDNESFYSLWQKYLVKDSDILTLPFLYLIRQKFGDLGITTSWIDEQIRREASNLDSNTPDPSEKCFGVIRQRLQYPLFLELLWSYWEEEGMLVQTMNAITVRFQNMKSGYRDPLAEMEISHLRPLNNILWGYIQDQQHLLSVKRRAYEYDHHYGITLQGKAVPTLNSADSRVRFIGAFHNLLNITAKYYVESANKLVEPDPFNILNALRDVHFIIAEGMHNQYGDLPTTARQEMLMQQWILAQPEFGQFLPGRSAIPFTEPWMDRVAAMNRLQGWTDTSPMHFDNLAKFGEQILLSIRFADWSDQGRSADEAALWANYFRSQIQGYIHSYKAATGVELSTLQVGTEVDSQAPAVHLVKRAKVAQNGNIPQPRQNGVPVKRAIDKESY